MAFYVMDQNGNEGRVDNLDQVGENLGAGDLFWAFPVVGGELTTYTWDGRQVLQVPETAFGMLERRSKKYRERVGKMLLPHLPEGSVPEQGEEAAFYPALPRLFMEWDDALIEATNQAEIELGMMDMFYLANEQRLLRSLAVVVMRWSFKVGEKQQQS